MVMMRSSTTLPREYAVIVDLARRIEPDAIRLAEWWMGTEIVELDGMTPDQLIHAGKGELLERFLRAVLDGSRD